MQFSMLINVKMPTIVGILIFISMIIQPESLKERFFLFFSILVFMSSWNFMLSWDENEKSFKISGPGLTQTILFSYKNYQEPWRFFMTQMSQHTRLWYLSHILKVTLYTGMHNLWSSGLNASMGLQLHSYFVYWSREGSGETVLMRRLVWALAAWWCDKCLLKKWIQFWECSWNHEYFRSFAK